MYREIVTKAVIGKGKIEDSGDIVIKVDNNISKVLGCWVINHYYVSSFENNKPIVKGRYDLHIWYGFNNDTDTSIHKQTIDYVHEFNVTVKDGEEISDNNELSVNCVKYPTCGGLSLNDDGNIIVKVEKELSLDVIGETKLKVQISNSSDEWGNDLNSINVDYLNK